MKDYEALSKKHFDGQAAEYDQRDTYYYSQNGKISCRDIAEQIRALPYESLLDVGCGTGFLIDLLTRQKAARYFGLDLSDEMIRVAQEKAIPGASFTAGSAGSSAAMAPESAVTRSVKLSTPSFRYTFTSSLM